MSAFIVTSGALLEIGCPSTLNRSTEQQMSFRRTLRGKRKGFIRKGGRRSWSVEAGLARPSEVSTLEAVARGLGPYGWYPPEAVKGNLLSPQVSGFDVTPERAIGAGLIQLPDGTVATSVAHTGTGPMYPGGAVPVRPGMTVSAGVWALGGVRLQGLWRDEVGATTPMNTSLQSFTGWAWREVTVTPPASAVSLELALSEGTAYARPSISWGPTARNELGTGCHAAVIHSPSYTPVALWEGANYTDFSYQVVEVG